VDFSYPSPHTHIGTFAHTLHHATHTAGHNLCARGTVGPGHHRGVPLPVLATQRVPGSPTRPAECSPLLRHALSRPPRGHWPLSDHSGAPALPSSSTPGHGRARPG
jgi:hypothetical protein